jgi:hypothetical protein
MTQCYCAAQTHGENTLCTSGIEDRHDRTEGLYSSPENADSSQVTKKSAFETRLEDYARTLAAEFNSPTKLADLVRDLTKLYGPVQLLSFYFVTEPEHQAITKIRHRFSVIREGAQGGREWFEVVTSPDEVYFNFIARTERSGVAGGADTYSSYKLRFIPSGSSAWVILDISERDMREDSFVTAYRDKERVKKFVPKGGNILEAAAMLIAGLSPGEELTGHWQAKKAFGAIQPVMREIARALNDQNKIHLQESASTALPKLAAAIEAERKNAQILTHGVGV